MVQIDLFYKIDVHKKYNLSSSVTLFGSLHFSLTTVTTATTNPAMVNWWRLSM